MKKQVFFIFMACLLSGAFIGCHKPIKAAIFIQQDGKPIPEVYAEAGGTLQIASNQPAFTVSWVDKDPCEQKGDLQGGYKAPAICQIPKDTKEGLYILTITESPQADSGSKGNHAALAFKVDGAAAGGASPTDGQPQPPTPPKCPQGTICYQVPLYIKNCGAFCH